ncbi:MAG: hypothetical protein JW849_01290 [Phycisphaerae bacterium]|nr:hypothetical protein [Phycisphaerae bacterium]
MNYKRLHELFKEFAEYIESLHTLYLDCIAGFGILYERLTKHQNNIKLILGEDDCAKESFQDQCSLTYEYICGQDFQPASLDPLMKQGDIKERTKQNGKNYFLSGNQCIVSAYAYWDEYLRFEIGKALGALGPNAKNTGESKKRLNIHVNSDFWGDIRYLRQSILHHNGIAISDVSKCKLLKWFQPGDKIELDYQKMREIFSGMADCRNEIGRLSLPPSDAKFPST